MSTATQKTVHEDPPAEKAAPRLDPFAEILAHARDGGSKAQFMGKVLRTVTRVFGSPYAALHVRYAAEVIQDDFHVGPEDPQFWKPSLQAFLTESLSAARPQARRLRSRSGDTRAAFLSAPVVSAAGEGIGALAVVVSPIAEHELSARLARLDSLMQAASASAAAMESPKAYAQRTGTMRSDWISTASALGRASELSSPVELAFTVTNELQNKLGCEQVALGRVRRGRIRILSISGLDEMNDASPGVLSITAAMEECLDAGEIIACGRSREWTRETLPGAYRLHHQWQRAAGADAVASIPLRVADETRAILSLRSGPGRTLSRRQLENIRAAVEPLLPVLLLAEKAGRGVVAHAVRSAREGLAALYEPGRIGRKVAAVSAIAFLMLLLFGTWPYRLTVPCTVLPSGARKVVAPLHGVLAAVHVQEGERVAEGQILCEFDRRELGHKLAALRAEHDVARREADRARAAGAPAEVQLAQAKRRHVEAQWAIARERFQRAVVRSPLDGVVLTGDLRELLGNHVEQGSLLFEMAPLHTWTVELHVAQSYVHDVHPGQVGRFSPFSSPDRRQSFQIEHLHPGARLRENRYVFVAEATISAAGGLRPGMEGIARLEVGRRRISWILFHRLVNFLRLRLWV